MMSPPAATDKFGSNIGQHTFRPLVIGPSNIPLIVDRDAARRSPELAVLSVGAHRDHPDVLTVADAALAAATELDEARARFYSELVCHWLPEAARAILEAKMDIKHEFVSELSKRLQAIGRAEGEARGRAEGEARGRADALLHVLASRGIAVRDADAARIRSCSDVSMLDVWIERAVRVQTVEALFGSGD
jgi:hypothetical protein